MEIGIDSFAAVISGNSSKVINDADAIAQLLERIEHADNSGIDVFGIGEHHRKGFLDSAATLILTAAAARTKRIRLTSAVTVLSAADPVRPFQNPLPIWIGVGGTPESFIRAGTLGLPLMVAIIGGETHHFRPLVDLYREAGKRAGFKPEQLKVGMHSLGYVTNTTQEALDDFYPGYAESMTKIGKERGRPPMTRRSFEAQVGPQGALLVGSPEEVAEKILRHSDALGGISRLTFQMDSAELPHEKLMHSIALIGTRVKPLVVQ